jgi:AraC-like DNA-binding protein
MLLHEKGGSGMWQTTYFPFDTFFIDHIKNTEKNNMDGQHYHDTYELYLQMAGERYLFLDGVCHTLVPGDLVILKPFDIHYTASRDVEYYERYVLNFHSEELSRLLSEDEIHMLFEPFSSCVVHLDKEQKQAVHHYFEQADRLSKKNGFLCEKLLYSAVFQLLMFIRDGMDTAKKVTAQNIQPEIVTALEYISRHYQQSVDLETVSEAVHMSKYHFCRQFHRTTGATFLEYLYNIRLSKVHQLLLDSDMTLCDIAHRTGFSSAAHLSRIFRRRYQMSPRGFRRAAREKNQACRQ